MSYRYYSRRKRDWVQGEVERRKIEKQRMNYNLLGIFTLIIILLLALNMFQLGDRMVRLFSGNY